MPCRPTPAVGVALALALALTPAAGAAPGKQKDRGAGEAPPAVRADAAEGRSPLDLASARFEQFGPDAVRLELRTVEPFADDSLLTGSGRSLCVELKLRARTQPDERVCAVVGPGGLRLRRTTLDGRGRTRRVATVPAAVVRADDRTVAATVPFADLGLAPGRRDWRATSTWQGRVDRVPDSGTVPIDLTAPPATGCTYAGGEQTGRGTGRRIALTFDDGPAPITHRFLDLLEREQVPATFFVIGAQIPGHEDVLRRILSSGSLIGNHSLTHADLRAGGLAAAEEIRRTQALVRDVTGFTPCLFRPPLGAWSPRLVATAGRQSLTTVLWDVDPADYTNPGAGMLASRILRSVQDGSIVLSHDGGGLRARQTLAALPTVIRELRRRGYEFVTAAEILGLELLPG